MQRGKRTAVMNESDNKAAQAASLALKIAENREYTIIAVDGMCGSGKTTFAKALSELLGANLIHADDFFLPPEMRTPERLGTPGGNIHYERLKEQVIDRLRKPEAFSYDVFDCSKGRIGETRTVENRHFTVIEGSYSHHPALGDYADIKIFMQTSPEAQLERIKRRNGEKAAEVFKAKWIPLEKRYFDFYKIKENADMIIGT